MSKPFRICIHCADDWDEQDVSFDFKCRPCPTCGEHTYTLEEICDMANAYLSLKHLQEEEL
jgi:hypothetical protein